MSFFDALIHAAKLSSFRKTRTDFYLELARSIEAKEQMRIFLQEELKIARSPKTRNASRAYALQVMERRQAIADQNKLSQLLGSVMPESDRGMLVALDDSPDKPALLRTVVDGIQSQKLVVKTLLGKIIAPLMVVPMIIAYCYIIATQSLPILVSFAPPEVWTPFNMAVRTTAEMIAAHTGKTVLILLAVGGFYFYQMPRWIGPWRLRAESVSPRVATYIFPVFPFLLPLSIYRNLKVGQLFSSLAVMLKSGRTVPEALNAIRENSQPWMRWHVRRVISHLEVRPTEYKEAFARGLLSPHLLARLSSQIRNASTFDEVLIRVGTQGGEEVRVEIAKQAGVINGMLMAGACGMVLFMALGNQVTIPMALQEQSSPVAIKKRTQKKQAEMRRLNSSSISPTLIDAGDGSEPVRLAAASGQGKRFTQGILRTWMLSQSGNSTWAAVCSFTDASEGSCAWRSEYTVRLS